MNKSCRCLADCLAAGWLLFELFCFLSERSPKGLHVSFQSLKLRSNVFILWDRRLTVYWRNSCCIITALEVLVSIGLIRQKVYLLLILVFFIDDDSRIPRSQIILSIDNVANAKRSDTYSFF